MIAGKTAEVDFEKSQRNVARVRILLGLIDFYPFNNTPFSSQPS
jgi:hypothetical protein